MKKTKNIGKHTKVLLQIKNFVVHLESMALHIKAHHNLDGKILFPTLFSEAYNKEKKH